ncbi:Cytochrome P450 85A1 [Camellia lanceoleosa]|uniref:Cytochrome P450 85A1 n=1 Tax=Camellia lanceoleosa TaxID=1840588 RepID=A0ACC0H7W0_9ERIC|nr:Cytochrome P450 85A1 [Camellia lanceoleosa]
MLAKLDIYRKFTNALAVAVIVSVGWICYEMAFLSSLNQIASIEWESMSGEFMPEFFKLVLGTLSLPINFPGTNYHRVSLRSSQRSSRTQERAFGDKRKEKGRGSNQLERFQVVNFTRSVIFETSRLATIVNGVLRKTTQDMELNGFVIPKGWRIYVYTRENNCDPCLYPDPSAFNPWRWMDKSSESQNYFFMFGGGTRQCPGKELGIAEISTFLHYFVTRYRWEEVGGDKLMKFPRVEAPNGLHIRDQGLEVISEGLDKLKDMACDLNEEIDRQVPLMDGLTLRFENTSCLSNI